MWLHGGAVRLTAAGRYTLVDSSNLAHSLMVYLDSPAPRTQGRRAGIRLDDEEVRRLFAGGAPAGSDEIAALEAIMTRLPTEG